MRAVVITSHGGVDGIGVLEVESPPTPVADRVRVRVHAAGLNRADILQRRGSIPRLQVIRRTFLGWSSPAKSNRLVKRSAP